MSETTVTNEFYKRAFDALPYSVLIHDAERIVYANRAALQTLNASCAEQVIGEPVDRFTHAVSKEVGMERRRLMFEQGLRLQGISVRLKTCTGEEVEVWGEAGPLVVGDDKYVLVTMRWPD